MISSGGKLVTHLRRTILASLLLSTFAGCGGADAATATLPDGGGSPDGSTSTSTNTSNEGGIDGGPDAEAPLSAGERSVFVSGSDAATAFQKLAQLLDSLF